MFQLTLGKCFTYASFLSNAQKHDTDESTAYTTGSLKSPPGGETDPRMLNDPSLSGVPKHFILPALSKNYANFTF